MKNGDIFYTFDDQTNLVKRMVFTDDADASHVRAVEITGTTSFSSVEVWNQRVFKTAKDAFEAMKNKMRRDHEIYLHMAVEDFERMYESEETE